MREDCVLKHTNCTYIALTIVLTTATTAILTTDTTDNIFRAATTALASTWQAARTGTEDAHKCVGYDDGDHAHNNNDNDNNYYGGSFKTTRT